jgi:hypothetical protein
MISARSSGVKVLDECPSLNVRGRSGHIVAHGALAQLAVLVRLVEPRNRSAIFQIRLAFVFDMARIVSLRSMILVREDADPVPKRDHRQDHRMTSSVPRRRCHGDYLLLSPALSSVGNVGSVTTPSEDFRNVVLRGANVASYKFVLAKSILMLAAAHGGVSR